MKKITIPKEWHYASNVFPWTPICPKDTIEMYRVYEFTDSCKYEIDEKSCVNKLCGFSIGLHHNNSVRVGWTYDKSTDKFMLWSYIYVDGKLIKTKVKEVEANKKFSVLIVKESQHIDVGNHINTHYVIIIQVLDEDDSKEGKYEMWTSEVKYWFSYKLEPYFGGNSVAPHKMTIIRHE